MKKALLSLAVIASALSANAQGLTPVGADIVIAPSSRWSGSELWSAKTYVVNSGLNYGEWTTDNPNYNVICGEEPADDSWGNHWYDVEYDTEDEATIGDNFYTGEEIFWEEHDAPFSSDDTYHGLPSYKWTTSSVMADIYFRRSFTTTNLLSGKVYLACGHDDAPCEYYLNGVLVFSKDGDPAAGNGWNEGEFIQLTDEQKALIKRDGSENILAVHVHQNWGGALADVGIYTLLEGGVDMGYITPWEGRSLFNSWGGYNFNGQSQFRNAGAKNEWEALYEAGADDVYTIHEIPEGMDKWLEQFHFKTPIDIVEGHDYTFKATLTPTGDFDQVLIKLCDNNDDENELLFDEAMISAGEDYEIEESFTGQADNLKIVFDFGMGYDGESVSISKMSVYDETEGKELWVGTHYFNYMYFCKEGEQVKSPKVTGRVETKAWTQLEFDDEAWDHTMMPIGSEGYMPELQTIWPGNMYHPDYTRDGGEGENTGYWIRRTFEMDEINPNLTYKLLVCHDDDYQTYVNGHLLQENVGWSNGKNPFSVRIPNAYLNTGKNVIATEIHQNWGGRFYDCGIGIEEIDFAAQKNAVQEVVDLAVAFDGDLTLAMKDSLNTLINEGKDMIENCNDAWDLREYAAELSGKINTVISWSGAVVEGRESLAFYSTLKGAEIAKYLPTAEEFEACKTANEINAIFANVKIARKRDAQLRHHENYTGSEVAEGDFYIYNVGERLFLGGGETWGAHCALEYTSNAMTLTEAGVENGYIVQTHRPNGAEGINDFMGYNGYMDVASQDVWVFEPVEGKQNVYTIRRADDNGENGVYLGYRGGDNQNGYSWCTVDTDMRSADVVTNQWMLITKEEMDALALTATAENPVDMSHLIVNPGFDQRWTLDAWEGINAVWGRGGNYADFIHEAWNSDCALGQSIYDDAIIPGWYTLECNGFYRDGNKENHAAKLEAGEEPEQLATLYANDDEMLIKRIDQNDVVIPYTINSTHVYNGVRCPDFPTDAAEAFEHRAYNNILKFEVTDKDAGEIYFGVETAGGAEECWTVVDNFRLKYWGTTDPGDNTGIEAITNVKPATANAIYNLQGQKLNKLNKGVNIINGIKVIIK